MIKPNDRKIDVVKFGHSRKFFNLGLRKKHDLFCPESVTFRICSDKYEINLSDEIIMIQNFLFS